MLQFWNCSSNTTQNNTYQDQNTKKCLKAELLSLAYEWQERKLKKTAALIWL